jgi:glucose-1-phosphate thymidylyltransferase
MSGNYKGIILAGGSGTRLQPLSNVVSKQLMNVYDKPLIYYPISTLMFAGIRDILIISTEEAIPQFKTLLGDGSKWGVSFTYMIQDKPNGVVEAFILGEEFIGDDNVCLILGDNIIYGNDLEHILNICKSDEGATILSYPVKDPERFGVVEFDGDDVISIEEKPRYPKSNRALIGLYFYDNKVLEYAKQVKPSKRNELEITDLNRIYLEKKQLRVKRLYRGISWIDALLTASNLIHTLQKVQSYKICCPEEISYRNKWIDSKQLYDIIKTMPKSEYGKYLDLIYKNKI